jgi:hypothetical protein
MRLEEKGKALFRGGHPETKSSEEKLRKPVEIRHAKGAKPGDKVVRLIRRLAAKNKRRRQRSS